LFTLLIWIVIAAMGYGLWRINRRPIRHSASEVAFLLTSLLKGTTGSREWAYFMSVHLADPRLESIRKRCVELFVRGSPAVKRGETEPYPLTELGKRQVSELLVECESLVRKVREPADAAD
jgi:hypothetical protein